MSIQKKMISDTFEKEKDVINSFWKMGTLMEKVDEIQTAYNVDAVVSELDKASCVAQPVGWSIQKYGFVLEDRRMRWLYHVFYIFTGSL